MVLIPRYPEEETALKSVTHLRKPDKGIIIKSLNYYPVLIDQIIGERMLKMNIK